MNSSITTMAIAVAIVSIIMAGIITSFSRGNATASRARVEQVLIEMEKLETRSIKARVDLNTCRRNLKISNAEIEATNLSIRSTSKRNAFLSEDLGETRQDLKQVGYTIEDLEEQEAVLEELIKTLKGSKRDLGKEIGDVEEVIEDIGTLTKQKKEHNL